MLFSFKMCPIDYSLPIRGSLRAPGETLDSPQITGSICSLHISKKTNTAEQLNHVKSDFSSCDNLAGSLSEKRTPILHNKCHACMYDNTEIQTKLTHSTVNTLYSVNEYYWKYMLWTHVYHLQTTNVGTRTKFRENSMFTISQNSFHTWISRE